MIPYDDLVVALAGWRQRQGLPVAPALGAAVPPPLPAPPEGACPDVVELFSRHLEDEISGSVCAEMEAHLAGCSRCRRRCDELRRLLVLCQQES
ncbi:MAG TPA: zf-HC2 domain-containing protein, partial [Kofleriaceae bacterium]|nr:zf-HC2 domain-containing protein [Kofleriaceae bacterium]